MSHSKPLAGTEPTTSSAGYDRHGQFAFPMSSRANPIRVQHHEISKALANNLEFSHYLRQKLISIGLIRDSASSQESKTVSDQLAANVQKKAMQCQDVAAFIYNLEIIAEMYQTYSTLIVLLLNKFPRIFCADLLRSLARPLSITINCIVGPTHLIANPQEQAPVMKNEDQPAEEKKLSK